MHSCVTLFLFALAIFATNSEHPSPCGHSPLRSHFVVGGHETARNQWPWMVSLRYQGQFCGGVLIHERMVVTAAHCMFEYFANKWKLVNLSKVKIVTGAHDYFKRSPGEAWLNVSSVHMHPRFKIDPEDPEQYEKVDLALLILNNSNPNYMVARPICLPDNMGDKANKYLACYAVGWGQTKCKNGSCSHSNAKTMQSVFLRLRPSNQCTDFNYISSKMFCGGNFDTSEENVRVMCMGDSGGPLMCSNDLQQWVLSGVTSTAHNNCKKGPTGFTDVARYVTWIRRVAKEYGLELPIPAPEWSCDYSRIRMKSRLEIRKPKLAQFQANKWRTNLHVCMKHCCERTDCHSANYFPNKRLCQILSQSYCQKSRKWIYPAQNYVLHLMKDCKK